jgi:uncharacterized membrane protein
MAMDALPAAYVPLARVVESIDGPALRWEVCCRPTLTPRQAVTAFTVLAAMGAMGAVAGWLLDHVLLALAFAGEAATCVMVFLHYARHACDREVITLAGSRLEIERRSGHHSRHDAFDVDWVRVDCDEDTRGLVRLSQRQAAVTVGRHLSPPCRWLMAQELRRAVLYRRSCPSR